LVGSSESSLESALCLWKYISVFVRTYAELCRDRRRHARLRLNLNLNLNLNLVLYPALNRAQVMKPFKKPNALSFASKSVSDLVLDLNLNLSLFLVRLHPPGQSPVCHPHGEIVFPSSPVYYM
jgi:hypothetical protein